MGRLLTELTLEIFCPYALILSFSKSMTLVIIHVFQRLGKCRPIRHVEWLLWSACRTTAGLAFGRLATSKAQPKQQFDHVPWFFENATVTRQTTVSKSSRFEPQQTEVTAHTIAHFMHILPTQLEKLNARLATSIAQHTPHTEAKTDKTLWKLIRNNSMYDSKSKCHRAVFSWWWVVALSSLIRLLGKLRENKKRTELWKHEMLTGRD